MRCQSACSMRALSLLLSSVAALLFMLLLPTAHASATKSALLVIDMQGCFLPGGPVAVSGNVGPVVKAINRLKQHGGFDRVIFTQDRHPPNHVSFACVHDNKQPQQALSLSYTCVGSRWLGHGGPRLCNMTHLYPQPEQSVTCISSHDEQTHAADSSNGNNTSSSANSGSSEHTHPRTSPLLAGNITQLAVDTSHSLGAAAASLAARIRAAGCPEPVTEVQQVLWPPHCVRYTANARLHPDLDISPHDWIARKGWQPHIDAYSAFEDNSKLQSTGLAQQLRQEGIGRVVIAGVALEYCVMWSAIDAVAQGFETVLALDATLPVSTAGAASAVQKMSKAGVDIVQHSDELSSEKDFNPSERLSGAKRVINL